MNQLNEYNNFRQEIERIADQLCLAVKGTFDFSVEVTTSDQIIQKLCMLMNFTIDAARRSLSEMNIQNSKLTELDKLKSDFMANVSHELRTPLTLILGPLEGLISDKDSIPLAHQDNLFRIHRNAYRLYGLVNDLLDFTKLEAGKYILSEEVIDLNRHIKDIVNDAQGLAGERKLSLTFTPFPDLPLMMLDRKIIDKITFNLLSNALKFTPAGGHINVQLLRDCDCVDIIVTDTGIGIPTEQISKLFERFYQVDSSSTRTHEGTGIGLAMINQFTQLMDGKIVVASEEGKGSKFKICIPFKAVPENKKNQPEEEYKEKISSFKVSLSKMEMKSEIKFTDIEKLNIKGDLPLILLADDNPDVRSYIVSLIQDSYEIIEVENGKLALEAIYKFSPQVILSDVMMPEINGFELTAKIKSDPKVKNIPIILITAKAGKEAVVDSFQVGADDYLSKPFSAEELKARIGAALRNRQDYLKIEELNIQLNKTINELSNSKSYLESSNKELEEEIVLRKILEEKNSKLNSELVIAARHAGMADIAASVLHNIGNALNSVTTSTTFIGQRISTSKTSNLIEISKLLEQHESDMAAFITNDPQGQRIPKYITKLAEMWKTDKEYLTDEINNIQKGITHIKEIINKQNSLSKVLGVNNAIIVPSLIEDALILNKTIYSNINISIKRDFNPIKEVVNDRVKLLQILVNLIKNGIESILEKNPEHKEIILSIREKNNTHFDIQLCDNGVGIGKENLEKIFSFGFTTKKEGHGFGLHSSAISIQDMGGNLSVTSDGLGKGATFSITLPYQPSKKEDRKNE
ncbi:MAG: ATP-binding protein [Alphaproteobacteria bacterium]|nr:ATP-binding protein [Alphaproteobacteria bacterium]